MMRTRSAITGLILAFAITAFAVPNESLAQEQTTEHATFENLVAALNNISVETQEFEALDDLTVENVQVVNVDDVLRGADVDSLGNAAKVDSLGNAAKVDSLDNAADIDPLHHALNRDEAEVTELEYALSNHEVLNAALSNLDVAVSDVVAIDVLSDGDVIVYYRPE